MFECFKAETIIIKLHKLSTRCNQMTGSLTQMHLIIFSLTVSTQWSLIDNCTNIVHHHVSQCMSIMELIAVGNIQKNLCCKVEHLHHLVVSSCYVQTAPKGHILTLREQRIIATFCFQTLNITYSCGQIEQGMISKPRCVSTLKTLLRHLLRTKSFVSTWPENFSDPTLQQTFQQDTAG